MGGYAIFLVVLGYFKTIAKFKLDASREPNNEKFKEGFADVFTENNDGAREKLWDFRCGIYHSLMPDKKFIPISRDINQVFEFEDDILIINPAFFGRSSSVSVRLHGRKSTSQLH